MRRRLGFFASAVTALCLFSLPASAATNGGSIGTKTYKSRGCKTSTDPGDPATWACTTVTVPRRMVAGETIEVTFAFRARHVLKHVAICFSEIASVTCADTNMTKKYAVIPSGKTIRSVLQLDVPMVAKSGPYRMDNYTRFYAPPKGADTHAYWTAYVLVKIVLNAKPQPFTSVAEANTALAQQELGSKNYKDYQLRLSVDAEDAMNRGDLHEGKRTLDEILDTVPTGKITSITYRSCWGYYQRKGDAVNRRKYALLTAKKLRAEGQPAAAAEFEADARK